MEWFCHASYLPSQQNIDSILMPDADQLNMRLSTFCHCRDFQGSAAETKKYPGTAEQGGTGGLCPPNNFPVIE